MSSKLLPGGDAAKADAIQWRSAPGEAHALAPATADVSALESRIRMLEAELASRATAARQQALAEAAAAERQRFDAQLEPALASFRALAAELAGARRRMRAEAEHDIVRLAIAIAARILHREISVDPEALLGLVKAAFDRLNAREVSRLRLAPADRDLVERHRAALGFPPRLEVAADPSLRPNSAIFETARGSLDASLDTQLGEISRGFADRFGTEK